MFGCLFQLAVPKQCRRRRRWSAAAVALAIVCWPHRVSACPFCVAKSETLTSQILKSEFAAICKPAEIQSGSCRSWTILRPFKAPSSTAIGATITFSQPIGVAGPAERRLLLARTARGRLVVHRALKPPDEAFLDYVGGALATLSSSDPGKWSYFVDHLLSPKPLIAEDAFNELARASVVDLRWAAPRLAVERLKAAIVDDSTPADRVGLLGLLVGISGSKADAGFLTHAIEAPTTRTAMGLDGLLGGLFLLDARTATAKSLHLLTGPASSAADRRAALRALQFALAEGVVYQRTATLDAMRVAILLDGVGELTLDELRHRRVTAAWREVDQLFVRDLAAKRAPRGAVIRFLLADPRPEAKQHLATVEKRWPQSVVDSRHALRFEAALRDEWLMRNIGKRE